jgi:hypothetical protein
MNMKPFKELRKKMTPEQLAESEMQANLALLHLTLFRNLFFLNIKYY